MNPNINNLHAAYQSSRYPLILISDAGIIMRPEALTEMVTLMTPDIGIVHQIPFTTDRKGWAASMEKVGSYRLNLEGRSSPLLNYY